MKSMKIHTVCLICLTGFIDQSLLSQHLKKNERVINFIRNNCTKSNLFKLKS